MGNPTNAQPPDQPVPPVAQPQPAPAPPLPPVNQVPAAKRQSTPFMILYSAAILVALVILAAGLYVLISRPEPASTGEMVIGALPAPAATPEAGTTTAGSPGVGPGGIPANWRIRMNQVPLGIMIMVIGAVLLVVLVAIPISAGGVSPFALGRPPTWRERLAAKLPHIVIGGVILIIVLFALSLALA